MEEKVALPYSRRCCAPERSNTVRNFRLGRLVCRRRQAVVFWGRSSERVDGFRCAHAAADTIGEPTIHPRALPNCFGGTLPGLPLAIQFTFTLTPFQDRQ